MSNIYRLSKDEIKAELKKRKIKFDPEAGRVDLLNKLKKAVGAEESPEEPEDEDEGPAEAAAPESPAEPQESAPCNEIAGDLWHNGRHFEKGAKIGPEDPDFAHLKAHGFLK